MSKRKLYETTIPFSGFYETAHGSSLDDALSYLTQNDMGEQMEIEGEDGETVCPGDDMWEHIHWNIAHSNYARLYAKNFISLFKDTTGIDLSGEIPEDALESPREYNFTTDRDFIKIPLKAIYAMWKVVDREKLDKLIQEKFTSYDGFMSYYPNTLDEWTDRSNGGKYGPVRDWDHNMLGTLIECLVYQFDMHTPEFTIDDRVMEDADCNGELTAIVYEALTVEGKQIIDDLAKRRLAQEYFNEHQMTLTLGKEMEGTL